MDKSTRQPTQRLDAKESKRESQGDQDVEIFAQKAQHERIKIRREWSVGAADVPIQSLPRSKTCWSEQLPPRILER